VTTYETSILVKDLIFPECPRWHDERLWFSDMHAHKVMTVDLEGKTEIIVEVPGQPAGLGWLPNGRLLVVSQTDMRLWQLESDNLREVADLSNLAVVSCNDMVVDRYGRAYIGHFGFDINALSPSPAPAAIIMVRPEGDIRIVADNLMFPNGMVITPDGHKLIVAETLESRLTAFDIESDGLLSGRRIWADLPGISPDGICLDVEGAVWVATLTNEVIRVNEGGKIIDRVSTSTLSFACMLGGQDGRTLFILEAESFNVEEVRAKKSGRIEVIRVESPGSGLP
jgi:sugar lactone lactonase YvrE